MCRGVARFSQVLEKKKIRLDAVLCNEACQDYFHQRFLAYTGAGMRTHAGQLKLCERGDAVNCSFLCFSRHVLFFVIFFFLRFFHQVFPHQETYCVLNKEVIKAKQKTLLVCATLKIGEYDPRMTSWIGERVFLTAFITDPFLKVDNLITRIIQVRKAIPPHSPCLLFHCGIGRSECCASMAAIFTAMRNSIHSAARENILKIPATTFASPRALVESEDNRAGQRFPGNVFALTTPTPS